MQWSVLKGNFSMKLILAVALAASQLTAQSPEVVDLVAISTRDFQAHLVPPVADARNVRVGQYPDQAGGTFLIICGEVLQTGADARNADGWMPFATIKMMDYEQWNGPSSDRFCNDPSVTWYSGVDLTADFKRDLNLK